MTAEIDKRLFDIMLPLSSVGYTPFKSPEREKEYIDYLTDLKIRLYQHGAKEPDKWMIVAVEEGTAQPIYVENEVGNLLKDQDAQGTFYTYKTSLSDIDNMIRQIANNTKI